MGYVFKLIGMVFEGPYGAINEGCVSMRILWGVVLVLLPAISISAESSFTVKFDLSGDYYFWIRYRSEKDASLLFSIDDNYSKKITLPASGEFNWKRILGPFRVGKGNHRFFFRSQQTGFFLDKLDITLDPEYLPSGAGSGNILQDLSNPVVWKVIHLNGTGGMPFFGDFNDDGLLDFVLSGSRYLSVYDHSGSLLWSKPISAIQHAQVGSGFYFRPYDINGDGLVEILGPILMGGTPFLAVLKGIDGTILDAYPLDLSDPNLVYESSNIANLGGGERCDAIIVKSNHRTWPYSTFRVDAFLFQNGKFIKLWSFGKSGIDKGIYHNPLAYDIDQDGKDEILLGHWLLDEDGSVIWEKSALFFDSERHVDSMFPGDISPVSDGIEIAVSSGYMLLSGVTGSVLWKWDLANQQNIEGQSVAVGELREDYPGKEILIAQQAPANDEYLFSYDGTLITTYNGPPEFDASYETTLIQWIGDPALEIVEQPYGRGRTVAIFDGHLNPLGEIDPSFTYGQVGYRVANITGDFREEFVFFNRNFLVIVKNDAPNPFSGTDPWVDPEYARFQFNWVYY